MLLQCQTLVWPWCQTKSDMISSSAFPFFPYLLHRRRRRTNYATLIEQASAIIICCSIITFFLSREKASAILSSLVKLDPIYTYVFFFPYVHLHTHAHDKNWILFSYTLSFHLSTNDILHDYPLNTYICQKPTHSSFKSAFFFLNNFPVFFLCLLLVFCYILILAAEKTFG